MTLSLRPEHLRRYKDVARLLVKHGRADLVRAADLDQALLADDPASWDSVDGDPEALAADLEALGPTFIKLGQILSTRSDLLPPPYLEALSRLQDRVEPFPFEEVEEVVAEELGVRPSKAFDELDPELPSRLNRLFEQVLRNELEVKLDVVDERLLMRNLQKIANRTALGVILAALIVGAALMMRVETEFTILGYPGIAMLLFLAAAACGFVLVANILYHDYWKEGRGPGRRRSGR